MAEDSTVQPPPSVEGGGEQSLEALRQELAEKQSELAGLRAQREQATRDAVARVQAAQLRQAIQRVEAEIAVEESQVEVQEQLDAELVGTGVPEEGTPEPKPLVDPEKVAETLAEDGPDGLYTQPFGEAATLVSTDEQVKTNDDENEGSDR